MLVTVFIFFCNYVIRSLVRSADGLAAEFIQIAVELQYNRRLYGNEVVAFVYGREHIAISGNLLLVSCARSCLVRNKTLEALIRGIYTFDFV